jgi:hypothetical protein
VNELPHLQILLEDLLVLEIIGYINPINMRSYLLQSKKYLTRPPQIV